MKEETLFQSKVCRILKVKKQDELWVEYMFWVDILWLRIWGIKKEDCDYWEIVESSLMIEARNYGVNSFFISI